MNKEILQSQPRPKTVIAGIREWNRRRSYDGKHTHGVKPSADSVFLHAKTEYVFPEGIPSYSWARRVEDRLAKKDLGKFSIQIDEPTSEIPSLYNPDEQFRLSSFTVTFTPDTPQPIAEKERSKEEIREEILELTKKLVEHKTVTGNTRALEEAIEDILLHVQKISQETGKPYFARLFHTEVNNGSSPIPSIVIATSKEALTHPTTIYLGHLDVIDGNDEEFKLQIGDDGTIKGRGVLDLKGPIAAQLALLPDFKDEAIVLTGDEEERDYSAHALAQVVRPQTGIANLDGAYSDRLGTGSKGCKRILIKAENQNGNTNKHDAYTESASPKDPLALLHTLVAFRFRSAGKRKLPWGERTTINSGEYKGGFQANVVPSASEDVYSIRYPDDKALKKVDRFINLAIKIINASGRYPKLSARTLLDLKPAQFNWDHPFVKAWREITEAATEVVLGEEKAGGKSDVEHFTKHNPDIPVVSIQIPGSGFHLKYEETTITHLENAYKILYEHLIGTRNQRLQRRRLTTTA